MFEEQFHPNRAALRASVCVRPAPIPIAKAQFFRFGTRRQPSAEARKLEIFIKRLFSAASIFLIDNFSHFSRCISRNRDLLEVCSSLACPEQSRRVTSHSPSLAQEGSPISNRHTKKLEIVLSHRKQRFGKFLIDNFSAFLRARSGIRFHRNAGTFESVFSNPVFSPAFRRSSAAPCRP